MNRSNPWLQNRCVRGMAAAVVCVVVSIAAAPAFAQKAQFERVKPHVNVSGDDGGGGGGDIIIFDIVDSATAASMVGASLVAISDEREGVLEVIVVDADRVETGLLILETDNAVAESDEFDGMLLLVEDSLDEPATLAYSGYIRIKKLNSGG